MQIVDYIPHPRFKITVFKSGNRFIVKFDDSDHDLAVKFREGEVAGFGDIVRQVDQHFLMQVEKVFSDMAKFRVSRFQEGAQEAFEEII